MNYAVWIINWIQMNFIEELQLFEYNSILKPLFPFYFKKMKINSIYKIPFLPIRFFKSHNIQVEGVKSSHIFTSRLVHILSTGYITRLKNCARKVSAMRLPELQFRVTTCVCYRKTGRWLINYHSRNPKFEQFFPPARREGNSFISPELKNLHPEVYCYDVNSVFWLRPIFKTYHEPVWPDVRNFAIRAKTLPWVIFLVQFICFWAKFMSIHLVTLAHDRNSPHG